MHKEVRLHRHDEGGYISAEFSAMGSPCSCLIETRHMHLAKRISTLIFTEARRIEHKFSRYRNDNIVHRINSAKGSFVALDQETHALFSYADTCYQASDGMFDITSGILRKAWKFKPGSQFPDHQAVEALLPNIGWDKVQLEVESICVPAKMEIDLGGIGKEYAVDRVAQLVSESTDISVLVNFGGDIACSKERADKTPWLVGIEQVDTHNQPITLEVLQGGLATSGDAHRYLIHKGKRYGHILNPQTGYPVEDAPRSITVAAHYCTQAGMLATIAMLQGANARVFLDAQEIDYWCY